MSALETLRFASRTAAFAAYSVGAYAVFEAEMLKRGEAELEDVLRPSIRRYGSHIAQMFGIRVHAHGLPSEGFVPGRDARGRGRLFVMNHRSSLDILVCLSRLEGKLVSRADLATWPLIGFLAKRAGILFVDRENKRSAAQVMRLMISNIEAGVGVVIFPEGTTYAGDEVKPFKAGAFSVARRTGAEIIPVGIAYAGSGASFDEESFLAHMQRVAGQPATHVGFAVGTPISGEGHTQEELAELAHAEVQRLVHEARRVVTAST